MALKLIAFICIQLAIFNTANSQCLNRMMPTIAPNLLPITDSFLPNQLVLNPGFVPSLGPNIVDVPYPVPYQIPYQETLLPNQVLPATTIIQDSTVANNLANALQLLVVSQLLSNTLPTMSDVVVPGYGPSVELVGNLGNLGNILSPMAPIPSYTTMPSCGFGQFNYLY